MTSDEFDAHAATLAEHFVHDTPEELLATAERYLAAGNRESAKLTLAVAMYVRRLEPPE